MNPQALKPRLLLAELYFCAGADLHWLTRMADRNRLAADHRGRLPEASELRPGVVARSLVQDWLFRPAGVVAGPGEVAYLKQLRPVYEAFALPPEIW